MTQKEKGSSVAIIHRFTQKIQNFSTSAPTSVRKTLTDYAVTPDHLLINSFTVYYKLEFRTCCKKYQFQATKRAAIPIKNRSPQLVPDYLTSITRSGNACNLLLYNTYYRSFFVYIINVIEFSSGFYLQIYNIKSGLSSPPCFFHTSDYKSYGL